MSSPHPLLHRRWLAVAAMATALVAFPLGTLGSHQFLDVPDSNPFHADISALADSGVTTGCGGSNFCPSAFVTREQMAAFMNRLGALSPSKVPVVNADRLDGLDSTELQWQRYRGEAASGVQYTAHLNDASFSWNCSGVSVTPGAGEEGSIWSSSGGVWVTDASPSTAISLPFVFTATATDGEGHPAVWQGIIKVLAGSPVSGCSFDVIGTWDLLTAIA